MMKLLPLLRRIAEPTRRQLFRWSAASAFLLGCRKAETKTPDAAPRIVPAPAPEQGEVLTPAEWRTLEAASARILPSDDGPGAREAQVIRFIDAQLATRAMAPLVPIVRAGVQLLDKWARAQHGNEFAAVLPEHQDAVLSELSRGAIPVKSFPQKEFFRLLHGLTLEGFLSDPIHGGNANMIGWKSIGFGEPHRRTADDSSPHHHK
jgi:gluconate 2-dehydrogenase gamma chain